VGRTLCLRPNCDAYAEIIGDANAAWHVRRRERHWTAYIRWVLLARRIGKGSAGTAGAGKDLILILSPLKTILKRMAAMDVLEPCSEFQAIPVLIRHQTKAVP